MLRARAARFAECRREKLAKKLAHHQEASASLREKAKALLEKAARQEEIAMQKMAKLDAVNAKTNAHDDDDEKQEKATASSVEDDAVMWARVPAWVKSRIVARWAPEMSGDAESLAAFAALPDESKARVRSKAARMQRRLRGEASDEDDRRCRGARCGRRDDVADGAYHHRRHEEGRGGWWRAQREHGATGDVGNVPSNI